MYALPLCLETIRQSLCQTACSGSDVIDVAPGVSGVDVYRLSRRDEPSSIADMPGKKYWHAFRAALTHINALRGRALYPTIR